MAYSFFSSHPFSPEDPRGSVGRVLVSSVPGRQRVKLLAVTVAVALPLLRISRAAGVPTDDELGFRYGSYNEDDSRINVTTESADFNLGLSDNVRLTGNLVVVSISGATPTGAPPQTKWP